MQLLIRLVINALALTAAALLLPGIQIGGDDPVQRIVIIAVLAVIFGLVNALIRPVVLVLTCLLNVLTLGLFTLVINAAMLALTAWLAGVFGVPFAIDGFLTAFLGALIITIVSWLLSLVLVSEGERR